MLFSLRFSIHIISFTKTREIISKDTAENNHHLLSELSKNITYFASVSVAHIAHDVLSLWLNTIISPMSRGRL
jgi:hypothetical protein